VKFGVKINDKYMHKFCMKQHLRDNWWNFYFLQWKWYGVGICTSRNFVQKWIIYL